MITSGIIYVGYLIVYALASPFLLFSDVSPDSSFLASMVQVKDWLGTLHSIFPVTTTAILSTVGLLFAVEVVMFAYKGVMWIIKRIPFLN